VASTQQVTVPDVRGISVEDARSALEAEGLTLGEQTEKSDKNIAAGNVIDQSPESGNRIDEGSAVNVVVSTGVEETTVPTLVGLSLDQARQALDRPTSSWVTRRRSRRTRTATP
jgi:serine/threonine-protein kinase